MEDDDLAPVWKALADPTRRRVLDLLSTQPLTTGQLAAQFPVSRIAVMKHLTALVEANLVVARKRGRERWHYLNVFPLQELHERWLDPVAERWAASLSGLKRHLAATEAGVPEQGDWPLSIDVQQDVLLDAPRSRVFAALTREIAAWWGRPYLNDQATDLVLEAEVGGRFREVWGDRAGALLAIVTAIVPDERLELTGRLHMGVVQGVVDIRLEDAGTGTRLLFSHQAIGSVSEAARGRLEGGWRELIAVRLKKFVETGER